MPSAVRTEPSGCVLCHCDWVLLGARPCLPVADLRLLFARLQAQTCAFILVAVCFLKKMRSVSFTGNASGFIADFVSVAAGWHCLLSWQFLCELYPESNIIGIVCCKRYVKQ